MLPVKGKQRLINQLNIIQIYEHDENRNAVLEMSNGVLITVDVEFKEFINAARPAPQQGNIVIPQPVPGSPLR